ncbi:MAG TPA: aldo/keto reductase [Pyrinomonadaceae bacterium]|jgi:aryl-alcohol dehydrogenase-like predicted oxidoreductase|nr:aldo/keto reductase [Pyrinomonadaceae bacterium]
MTRRETRRKFLATGAVAAGGAVVVNCTATNNSAEVTAEQKSSPRTLDDSAAALMSRRALGRTGVSIPVFGLGGAGQTPLDKKDRQREAVALAERALELGVRYFDTAANYNSSEEHLGMVLAPVRDKLFLTSKTDARDRDGAWRELERSLTRLKTDHLDMWYMHHVSTTNDIEKIFGAGGAIHALEEAKRQKIVRFGAISGHHEPAIILEGLRRYDFDATLIPVNAVDKHHPRPFIPTVLPYAREKNIGVVAMKVPAYGRLFKSGALDGIHQAIGYTLSQPGVTACVIAAEDPQMLEQNVKAARAFKHLGETELAALEKRTAAKWEDNSFYRAWT